MGYTLWSFHIWKPWPIEIDNFSQLETSIVDFPMAMLDGPFTNKTSIYSGFSMAILNNQMVVCCFIIRHEMQPLFCG